MTLCPTLCNNAHQNATPVSEIPCQRFHRQTMLLKLPFHWLTMTTPRCPTIRQNYHYPSLYILILLPWSQLWLAITTKKDKEKLNGRSPMISIIYIFILSDNYHHKQHRCSMTTYLTYTEPRTLHSAKCVLFSVILRPLRYQSPSPHRTQCIRITIIIKISVKFVLGFHVLCYKAVPEHYQNHQHHRYTHHHN